MLPDQARHDMQGTIKYAMRLTAPRAPFAYVTGDLLQRDLQRSHSRVIPTKVASRQEDEPLRV